MTLGHILAISFNLLVAIVCNKKYLKRDTLNIVRGVYFNVFQKLIIFHPFLNRIGVNFIEHALKVLFITL